MDISSHTINYSQRKLGNNFKIINNNKIKQEGALIQNKDDIKNDDIILNIKPHQRSIEEIIISMRELFFKILEMLIDKENPIPYIFSSEYRQFDFTLFLLIIGTILLLFSNIMK